MALTYVELVGGSAIGKVKEQSTADAAQVGSALVKYGL